MRQPASISRRSRCLQARSSFPWTKRQRQDHAAVDHRRCAASVGGSCEGVWRGTRRARAHARDRFRADEIGFVFQLFNLIPYLSARDNILLPCCFSAARRRRIADAGTTPADEAQRLAARLDLPSELLARPAMALSVGQQQRGGGCCARADRPTGAGDRRRADFGAGCRPPDAFSRSAHGRVRRSWRGAALRESRPRASPGISIGW